LQIYTGKPPHHNLTHIASVIYTVAINRKRPEVPPPERVWTDTEVDMWWVVGKCWQHEPTTRPDIRLVKSYLEGLAANRAKKLNRSSPSPSGTEDISQEIAANEMTKAQRWIQEQMGSIVFKDLSQRRFDELSKTKVCSLLFSVALVAYPFDRCLLLEARRRCPAQSDLKYQFSLLFSFLLGR
jgi:hypothetical protein